MKNTEEDSKKRWYQYGDFWVGFIGWFVINFLLFNLQTSLNINLLIPLVINIVGIGVVYNLRPRIAIAALSAFGTLLVVTICIGIFFYAICFSGGFL